jgi:hypothetical protein
MEYDTAKRMRAEMRLRYNFSKGIYLRLDAATVKKLGKADGVPPTYLDARLAVGLNFRQIYKTPIIRNVTLH